MPTRSHNQRSSVEAPRVRDAATPHRGSDAFSPSPLVPVNIATNNTIQCDAPSLDDELRHARVLPPYLWSEPIESAAPPFIIPTQVPLPSTAGIFLTLHSVYILWLLFEFVLNKKDERFFIILYVCYKWERWIETSYLFSDAIPLFHTSVL